jgi:hypothetical protein
MVVQGTTIQIPHNQGMQHDYPVLLPNKGVPQTHHWALTPTGPAQAQAKCHPRPTRDTPPTMLPENWLFCS